MSDEQETGRVRIVMAPGDLRATDDGTFARPIRSRSEATRRLIRLGFGAKERRPEGAS